MFDTMYFTKGPHRMRIATNLSYDTRQFIKLNVGVCIIMMCFIFADNMVPVLYCKVERMSFVGKEMYATFFFVCTEIGGNYIFANLVKHWFTHKHR